MHRRLIVALIAVALLFAAADLALWHRAHELKDLQSRWDALAATVSVDPPRFRPEMVASLPAPARRYLARAIASGTPLRSTVRLEIAGQIAARPGGRWYPFSADKILVPGRGYVWRARMHGAPLAYGRTETYLDGAGRRSVTLLGVLPWRRRHGADASAVNRALLALQSIWDPASLLPFRGVQWKAADPGRAVAILDIDGRAIPLTLEISPRGELRSASVRCPRRGVPDARFALHVDEQMRADGYRIPRRVTAAWRTGRGLYQPVGRQLILAIEYR